MSARPTPRWPVRSGVIGLGIALLWGIVLYVALQPPGRDYQSVNLLFRRPNATFDAAVPLRESGSPQAERTLRLAFQTAPGMPLAGIRSIGFLADVSTDTPHPVGYQRRSAVVTEAEIVDENNRALFRAAGPFTLTDDTLLEFAATPALNTPGIVASSSNEVRRLELRLKTRAPENLALWVRAVPSDPNGFETLGWLRIPAGTLPAPANHHLYLTGHYTVASSNPPLTRWALVNFLWNTGASPPVASVLVLATLLIGAGAMGLALAKNDLGNRAVCHAAAAALLTAGLGFTYAAIHPPFTPPDEADHLLSYAEQVGDSRLPEELLSLARRNHIERIRARVYEHFSAADTFRATTNYWEEHVNTTPIHMRSRSSTTCRVWTATRPAITGAPTGASILRLRLIHALLLALSIGAAVLSLGRLAADGTLHAVAWLPWLCAPGLVLFGMEVSNYFLVIAVQCLTAALLVPPWRIGPADRWRGLALGLSIGAALVTSRAAVPLACAAAIALLARLAAPIPARTPRERWQSTGEFWGLLALGVFAPSLLSLEAYGISARSMWQSLLPAGTPAFARSLPFALGVALVAAAAGVLEGAVHTCRQPTAEASKSEISFTARVFRWLGPLGVIALCLLPIVTPDSGLGYSTDYKSPAKFVADAWLAFAGSFGLGARDFMSSDTFWRACGHNEAAGSSVLAGLACLLVTTGWALAWWHAPEQRGRRTQILCLGVAVAAYVTLLAYGGFREMHGITGRYMAGVYVLLLLSAGAGWNTLASRLGPNRDRWLWPILLLPFGIHATHVFAVLGRFF